MNSCVTKPVFRIYIEAINMKINKNFSISMIMLLPFLIIAEVSNAQIIFTDSGQSLGAGRSFGIVLGDLDGDNDLDAFITDYIGSSQIWVNDGDGIFSFSGQGFGSGSDFSHGAAIGDLDNDDDNDILVMNGNGNCKVLINDGTGIFTDSGQSLGLVGVDYGTAILADVDDDGDLDAFAVAFGNSNELWMNDGNGVFTNSSQILGSNTSRSMGIGDLDADDDLDFFLTQDDATDEIWFNDGDGNFTNSGQNIGDQVGNEQIVLADLDGDDDLDAFITNGDFPNQGLGNKVWINDGNGFFNAQGDYFGHAKWNAVGDIDRDGDIDAITCHNEQANKVWLNDGTGTFAESIDFTSNGIAVAFGDVDNDNDLDVFIGYGENAGGNKLFFNNSVLGVDDESLILPGFQLHQNFPNPLNPSTTINFELPVQSFVSLNVYDVLGKEVATLVEKDMLAGIYYFNFDASELSSGVYYYRLNTGNYAEAKKMVLIN